MALQFSVAIRNGMLDQIESVVGVSAIVRMYTGAPPADCATATSGSQLVTVTLTSDWAANAASGAKSFSGTPIAFTGGAAGTLGYWRLWNNAVTACGAQGTITATGGGGDMTVDNTSITNGQTGNITSWTINAGNA